MLDLNLIREKPDLVRTALKNRQMDPSPVDDILRLDEKRRSLLTQVEALKAERNAVSKEIGKLKDAAEREKKIAAMREVGDRITVLDKEVAEVEAELHAILSAIPNIPDERVRFIKGWIEDTLPVYQVEEHEVLVIFIDTDLYSSTYFVLKHLKDYFKVGTLFYFDEFAVLEHELQAFDNFMRESGMKFELIAADYGMMNVAFRRVG